MPARLTEFKSHCVLHQSCRARFSSFLYHPVLSKTLNPSRFPHLWNADDHIVYSGWLIETEVYLVAPLWQCCVSWTWKALVKSVFGHEGQTPVHLAQCTWIVFLSHVGSKESTRQLSEVDGWPFLCRCKQLKWVGTKPSLEWLFLLKSLRGIHRLLLSVGTYLLTVYIQVAYSFWDFAFVPRRFPYKISS